MAYVPKNYFKDGGDTLVLDGEVEKNGSPVDIGGGSDIDPSNYVKKSDFEALKQRVKDLENAGSGA